MTYEVYKYVVRGLYEEHKFMFTLLMCLKIDMQSGKLRHDEFQTLIKGGASLDLNVVQPKPCKWIMDSTWLNLVELSKLYQFSAILEQIPRNDKQWRTWTEKDAPENEMIPDGYNNSLDSFRKLLLIRSWCPDRTLLQAKRYISDSLNEKFIEGIILDIDKLVEESDPLTPLICFLSSGSDPTPLIEQSGKRKNMDVKAISMGQGQEIHASFIA
jgi:dynein heavy chain